LPRIHRGAWEAQRRNLGGKEYGDVTANRKCKERKTFKVGEWSKIQSRIETGKRDGEVKEEPKKHRSNWWIHYNINGSVARREREGRERHHEVKGKGSYGKKKKKRVSRGLKHHQNQRKNVWRCVCVFARVKAKKLTRRRASVTRAIRALERREGLIDQSLGREKKNEDATWVI